MDDIACYSSNPQKHAPSVWMTPAIPFLFPVSFSARVTSIEHYWVILAERRTGPRLLIDFFEHEMLVAALLGHG